MVATRCFSFKEPNASLMFLDSNDTLMGLQAAAPTNYANMPTVPLEGVKKYTTYGIWENIAFCSDQVEALWFHLAAID